MARFARIVAPGVPHHVTPRGNLRRDVFFMERLERETDRSLRPQKRGTKPEPEITAGLGSAPL